MTAAAAAIANQLWELVSGIAGAWLAPDDAQHQSQRAEHEHERCEPEHPHDVLEQGRVGGDWQRPADEDHCHDDRPLERSAADALSRHEIIAFAAHSPVVKGSKIVIVAPSLIDPALTVKTLSLSRALSDTRAMALALPLDQSQTKHIGLSSYVCFCGSHEGEQAASDPADAFRSSARSASVGRPGTELLSPKPCSTSR